MYNIILFYHFVKLSWGRMSKSWFSVAGYAVIRYSTFPSNDRSIRSFFRTWSGSFTLLKTNVQIDFTCSLFNHVFFEKKIDAFFVSILAVRSSLLYFIFPSKTHINQSSISCPSHNNEYLDSTVFIRIFG